MSVSKGDYNPLSYTASENSAVIDLMFNAEGYAEKVCMTYCPMATILRLPGSTTNAVFAINSEDDVRVLKILPFDRLAHGEVHFLEQWGTKGLKVPLLRGKNFNKDIIPYNFFFMDYIQPNNLLIKDLDGTDIKRILIKVTSLLKRGHEIPETAFGWINYHSNKSGDNIWQDTLKKITQGRGRALVDRNLVEVNELNTLEKTISEIDERSVGCSLLHGDLRVENIIVSPNRNVTLIDPDPIGGDGLYDIAYLSTSLPEELDMYGTLLQESYLGYQPSSEEMKKWYLYRALATIRQTAGAMKKETAKIQSSKVKRLNRMILAATRS